MTQSIEDGISKYVNLKYGDSHRSQRTRFSGNRLPDEFLSESKGWWRVTPGKCWYCRGTGSEGLLGKKAFQAGPAWCENCAGTGDCHNCATEETPGWCRVVSLRGGRVRFQ